MDYAIKTLEDLAVLFGKEKELQKMADDYIEASRALRDRREHRFSAEVYHDLIRLRDNIESGLSDWGNGYEVQRLRQEVRLDEVNEALVFVGHEIENRYVNRLLGL